MTLDRNRIPLCGFRQPHDPHPFVTSGDYLDDPSECHGWPSSTTTTTTKGLPVTTTHDLTTLTSLTIGQYVDIEGTVYAVHRGPDTDDLPFLSPVGELFDMTDMEDTASTDAGYTRNDE